MKPINVGLVIALILGVSLSLYNALYTVNEGYHSVWQAYRDAYCECGIEDKNTLHSRNKHDR